jgi:hypothetical protein
VVSGAAKSAAPTKLLRRALLCATDRIPENIMRSRFLACIFLVTLVIPGLAAETRDHYIVIDRDRAPMYRVTRIWAPGPNGTQQTFLIANVGGPLLRIDLTRDYLSQERITLFALAGNPEANARLVVTLPSASTTAKDLREELQARPELRHVPVPIRIEGRSNKMVRGLDADWSRQTNAELRNRVRQVVGEDLMEALLSIKDIAGLPMFAELNASLGYLVDPETLVYRSTLLVSAGAPDCEFDRKFGVPCKG